MRHPGGGARAVDIVHCRCGIELVSVCKPFITLAGRDPSVQLVLDRVSGIWIGVCEVQCATVEEGYFCWGFGVFGMAYGIPTERPWWPSHGPSGSESDRESRCCIADLAYLV